MKLSMKWLADYTDVSEYSTKEYCDRMTATGSKVEGWEELGDDISGVVVGRVLEVAPHPDADKLVICKIDVGAADPLQIVTGATNVTEGALVPVATDGSHLPGDVKIKKGKLRGAVSEGMLCSIAELGLTLHDMPQAVEDGILILSDCGLDTLPKPGENVKEVLDLTDTVVEFEITPNRPDCLSVIGLARESAVSHEAPLRIKKPEFRGIGNGISSLLSVKDDAVDLCYRYSAAVVKNVRIAPSPMWMRRRLRAAGVRPINNIVDITNYVMLEYGQPMHAFDYACLDGSDINVRRAADGEKYVTLDNIEHTLDSSMLVIADDHKPVALAGVMGGANSGISDSTETVVFESAAFCGSNVRVTARKLGMRTESSSRFEKGLDPEQTIPALYRALELVEMLGAGDVVSDVIDIYPNPRPLPEIKLDADVINRFLGTDISEEFMKDTLRSLEFTVGDSTVIPPSFRADVAGMNDVAEEVIRIYGYEALTETLTSGGVTLGGRTKNQSYALFCENALCGMGMNEIETFSFISPKFYDKIRLPEDKRKSVVISNPLGEDTSVMRTTAIPSMLNVLAYNQSVKNHAAYLYEMATVYIPTENVLPDEPKRIVLGFYDTDRKDEAVFYRMKGIVDALMRASGIAVRYTAESTNPTFHPGRCAAVSAGGRVLGVFGEVHPDVAESYGFIHRTAAAELDFDAMAELYSTDFAFTALPKHPALERDFSFVCGEELEVGAIEDEIVSASPSVESVKLFDVYRGAQIGEGQKSVSFAVKLRSQDHTMNDEEADRAVKKILKNLAGKFGITLRS